MQSSIKDFIDKHKKLCLIIGLVICIFLLFAFYDYGNSKNIKHEEYYTSFSIEDVNEKEYPYHYVNKYDLDTTGENVIDVDLNTFEEDVFYINDAGTYRLTGKLSGRIHIDAKDEIVHLLLNNVDIEAYDGPALIVEDALRVVITLVDGSSNKIADCGYYKELSEYESAIQSNADLTINGNGFLDVYGLFKDGIRSKDVVKVIDGELSIHSKRTAIHGTDGINIVGGNIFIASEKYGFKTTKNGINNRGNLMVLGGGCYSYCW